MPSGNDKNQKPSFDDLVDESLREQDTKIGDDKSLDAERETPVEPPKDNAEYTVWYGTNRKPISKSGDFISFSEKRDNTVHYGQVTVFVPEGHKVGSQGSSWWTRMWSRIDDRLKILRLTGQTADQFWKSLQKELGSPNNRDAVIFIHGYNVSFNDAALSAAQLGFDLSVRSGMAFFSWPAQAKIKDYIADGSAIDGSEHHIEEFLIDFIEKSAASKVHVIAHSMGNRGLFRAINSIVDKARLRHPARFGQLILAAPDIDVDLFGNSCGAYATCAARTTLYVSAKDYAIRIAQVIHKYGRVGGSVDTYKGINTIKTSRTISDFIGHGYVYNNRPVITDIFNVLKDNSHPNERQLQQKTMEDGAVYWEIRP